MEVVISVLMYLWCELSQFIYEIAHSVNTERKAKKFFFPKEGYKIIYGIYGSFKSLAQLNKSPTFSDNLGQKSLPIGNIL